MSTINRTAATRRVERFLATPVRTIDRAGAFAPVLMAIWMDAAGRKTFAATVVDAALAASADSLEDIRNAVVVALANPAVTPGRIGDAVRANQAATGRGYALVGTALAQAIEG